MSTINAYLSFSGKCLEAMEFYQAALGGKLQIQKIGGSPLSDKMPAFMKEQVLHATLTTDDFVLMGTDCVPPPGLIQGNTVSLCMNCKAENEIMILYETLSEGGNKNFPLEKTFWNALFGGVTDKYGNHWLLNYDMTETNETKNK